MLDIVNVLSIIWLSIWLLISVKYILKHQAKSIHVVYLVFYIFFVIPLILDYLIGKPNYDYSKPGFYLASRDETTSYIYALFISIIPFIWRLFAKFKSSSSNLSLKLNIEINKNILRKITPFLILLIISPFIGWLFSPNPLEYLNYAASPRGLLSEESRGYHVFLSRLCLLSIVSVFILLFLKKQFKFMNLLIFFPWIFISVWIHGKRSIVIITILIFSYLIWEKKALKGFKLIIYGILVGLLFSLFSNFYQTNFRYNDLTNSDYIYENIRIDYGRDDVTKLAIYAELYPDNVKILEYRFQSLIFYATFFIPREWWPNKPYPYDHYVTSAMQLTPPQLWDSNMTTSILDELIANTSWIGMLIGPLIVLLICKIGDSTEKPLIRLLTILIASLSLVLHLTSFIVFVLIWILMVLYHKYNKKKLILGTH